MSAAVPEILALGEAMIEFNQSQPGRPEFLQGFGGDTSNFCIAAARQGASTGFVSAIGDDPFGRLLAGMWADEHVDTRYVRVDRSAPTGVYFVTHGPDGHQFDYLRAGSAASRYTAADLPLDALAAAKAVHLSGISVAISTAACDAAFAAIVHTRSNGGAVIREALCHTDICLPSWDDVAALTGANDRDAIVDAMLELGPQIVALKLGREGAYVATPSERRVVPGFAVEAVDATGAGDCFGGAFVARIVAGDDPFAAARYANAAAALSTTGYGAVAPIPHRDAVERLLRG